MVTCDSQRAKRARRTRVSFSARLSYESSRLSPNGQLADWSSRGFFYVNYLEAFKQKSDDLLALVCLGDIPGVLETNSPFVSSAPFTDMVDVDEFDFSGRLLRSRVNKSSLLPYLVFANKGERP